MEMEWEVTLSARRLLFIGFILTKIGGNGRGRNVPRLPGRPVGGVPIL